MPTAKPWLDRGQLPEDMALGTIYGRLRIVGYEPHRVGKKSRTYVIAVCLCGGIAISRPDHLRQGEVTSCGCWRQTYQRERARQRWAAVRTGGRPLGVGRPKRRKEAA